MGQAGTDSGTSSNRNYEKINRSQRLRVGSRRAELQQLHGEGGERGAHTHQGAEGAGGRTHL